MLRGARKRDVSFRRRFPGPEPGATSTLFWEGARKGCVAWSPQESLYFVVVVVVVERVLENGRGFG